MAEGPVSRPRRVSLLALLAVVALPYIGRAVATADGAEVVSESLGLFVQGGPGFGRMPPADASTPEVAPAHHSKYGLFPSLVPLPGLGAAWLVRRGIGAAGVDAVTAFTWSAGVLLAGLAFGWLVRVLRPDATGPWEAAFVAGTFLWPYAADSFVEPFAAAGLASGAALLLAGREPSVAAVPWAGACLLKPILWATTPVLILAFVLDDRTHRAGGRALRAMGTFAAALCLHAAANRLLYGSFFATGYGDEMLRFTTPIGTGLFGLLLSPGRGLLLFAPVVVAGVVGLRVAPRAALWLCAGAPLLHLLVVARWWSWEGGTAWGPRHLLPVLPLLAAPAALVAAGAVRAAFVAGALVNLPGVLIAPGAWDGYAEALRPPAGVAWPAAGPLRVSTIPSLAPVVGHAWLAARNVGGVELSRPWLAGGVTEGGPPPDAAASVSPWWLRRALGLPAVSPMVPRLLVRSAAGYLGRGETARALPWLREAVRLSPADPDAARLLAWAEGPGRGPAAH
ncbi:MAG TPA: hypothetical protein VGM13_06930 [Thermoanaerobaculia bacterium]|jgi:hypothetical protein